VLVVEVPIAWACCCSIVISWLVKKESGVAWNREVLVRVVDDRDDLKNGRIKRYKINK
jgi:hypothetical protein